MSDAQLNPDSPRPPRSLWEVMSHGADPAPVDPPPNPAEKSAIEAGDPVVPLNSLWKLMGVEPAELQPGITTKETTVTPLRDQETSKFDTIVEDVLTAEKQQSPSKGRTEDPSPQPKRWRAPSRSDHPLAIDIRKPKRESIDVIRSRKAVKSVWLGGLAIGLSGLALLPGMWTKFPALVVGFIALFSGFLAADEIRTSRGRVAGLNQAIVGMTLSIIGMFLGPLMSWTIGDLAAFQSNRKMTEARLEAVGGAVNQFYDRQREFPAGGTFVRQADGRERPMHGWMTSLLPYMGYEQLYRSINLSRPFDDAANAGAMRTQVPEFLVAGIEQTTSIKKYAAAHFAGVGGTERDAHGDEVHFGVFGKNSTVFQRNVTDGLSNTFLAGQLPGSYPAWGEPSNWRRITQGLNRDQRGFGSPDGGPVLFLMADGSVRSLAPDTDLRVLHSMSTRDGAD